MAGDTVRKAWFNLERDNNPSIQEVADTDQPLYFNRTEVEDQITVLMPGDDEKRHPLYEEPNDYMGWTYPELAALLARSDLPSPVRKKATRAILLKELAHRDRIGPYRP